MKDYLIVKGIIGSKIHSLLCIPVDFPSKLLMKPIMQIAPMNPEDKENFDPVLKTYSPVKLVNQKRYKTLRDIVMNNNPKKEKKEHPLKEKTNTEKREKKEECKFKKLEFEDETVKRYGI